MNQIEQDKNFNLYNKDNLFEHLLIYILCDIY
jgi:hypothetical protein